MQTTQEVKARFFLTPDELIGKLLSDTRIPAAERLDRVVVITELFGSEERFLSYLERVKFLLECAGFHGEFSSTAQDLRTRQGVERYKKILGESEFCFTLETFERRRELMGPLKGRPMSQVITLLKYAKESGFRQIVCNYIAGLDSQRGFEAGLSELVTHGVITAMTLNTFTPMTTLQDRLIHPDAKSFSYYLGLWRTRESLGVGPFRPTDYEKSVSFDPCRS